MAEARTARLDLLALGLFLAGLLVALAVFSYEPNAPRPLGPGGKDAAHTENLLGEPGDWLAKELIGTLGSAVHVFLASWFVLVLLLLMRRSWKRWARRLAGWLLLLPWSAVAADYLGPDWLAGP